MYNRNERQETRVKGVTVESPRKTTRWLERKVESMMGLEVLIENMLILHEHLSNERLSLIDDVK